MAKPRLTPKQRAVLETVRDKNAIKLDGEPTPLFINHLCRGNWDQYATVEDRPFWYIQDAERCVQALERKRFVRRENRNFLYITDEGREAIAP